MSKIRPEERYPLLLYFVDNSNDVSNGTGLYFEKGRTHGINSGATAIITKWPNYMSTCWVASLITSLTLFMITILLLSSVSSPISRLPRCVESEGSVLDNKTIHLVHLSNKWQINEFDLVEDIIKSFPHYKLHLIQIYSQPKDYPKLSSSDGNFSDEAKSTEDTQINTILKETTESIDKGETLKILSRKKRFSNGFYNFPFFFDLEPKNFLDSLFSQFNRSRITKPIYLKHRFRMHSLSDLLKKHPQIIFRNDTFNNTFKSSPLYESWEILNDDMKVFSVRILQLWQYGGLSFDFKLAALNKRPLSYYKHSKDKPSENLNGSEFVINAPKLFKHIDATQTTKYRKNKMKDFVENVYKNYENLPMGVVTADDRGIHMESKTPCHAFFGEILMNLKKSKKDMSRKAIIRDSLQTFCQMSAIDEKYCSSQFY